MGLTATPGGSNLVRSVVKPDLRGNLALHMTFPVNSGGPSLSI